MFVRLTWWAATIRVMSTNHPTELQTLVPFGT